MRRRSPLQQMLAPWAIGHRCGPGDGWITLSIIQRKGGFRHEAGLGRSSALAA
ncbi:hypothetical protein J4G37_18155 [Microvirga sp. 3-52]|nr:hypothetical protein [Microvirga sp. 3-52]